MPDLANLHKIESSPRIVNLNRFLKNLSARLLRRSSRSGFQRGWAVGRSEIHVSLTLTLFVLSIGTLIISFTPSYSEFRAVAVTLPLIWLGSLIVRLAAQQLAIGDFCHDFDITLCPTGNIQTDYEYLPPRTILAYAASGQLASLGLMSVALVVNAAAMPTSSSEITIGELLDFQGGWHSVAWATQIFWVNLFLFVLHLLPTVPFDLRALIFSALSWRSRTALEPYVFRGIGALNSHLAAALAGVGLTTLSISMFWNSPLDVWYALLAAAVYLFVASRWERSRAEELEAQYVPTPPREYIHAGVPREQSTPAPHLGLEPDEPEFDPVDLIAGDTVVQDKTLDPIQGEQEQSEADSEFDVDDLLRKVHRDGFGGLTDDEQRALRWASKEMQEKRESH